MTSFLQPGWSAAKQNWQSFKQRFKLPLWFVLIALFVLFTVGTVGIVQYLCFRNGQQATESLANQLMQNVSGRVELYLNSYLQTPQLVNQLNANAVLLGELDLQDLPGLEQHLFTQLKQFDSISSVQAGNSQQDLRAVTRHDGLRSLQANGTEPTQLEEYQLDDTGRKTQLLGTSEQISVRNQLWYQAALFAGQPTWGPISKLSRSDTSSLTAIQPVYDAQGQVQGVFATAIFLNAIGRFLHDLPVGTGEVFILEQDGWTIATSNQALPENDSLVNRFNLINSPVVAEQTAARSLLNHYGDFSRIDRPQQVVFSQQGQRHFLQILPFEDGHGLNWLIGVMVPESDFMEQIHIDTQMTLLLCAGVLTGSVLLGLGAARCVTRSIEQLSWASQSLAQGNWQESFQQDSPIVELQVLAQSLNQMAAQLQQSFDRVKLALQDSQEKFSQVFRICPDAIGIVTLEGRYVEVNDAFVNLFGYTQAEVIGRTAAEIGHWVDLEQRQRYVQLVQNGEPVRNLEFAFRNKTGDLLTVLFSADSMELQGQSYIVGIAKDITDRKQVEASLRQNEARFQRLTAASPCIIYSIEEYPGRPVRFEYLSPAFEEIQELPVAAAMENAKVAFDAFHPDDREGHQQAVLRALETMQPFKHEWRIITPSGKIKWVQANSRPEHRDNGVLVWHGVMIDITDRKRIEAERQQAEAALQQSEARFQRLAAAAPGAIYTLVKQPNQPPDQAFYFEYISPAIEEINELTVEQMLSRPAMTLIHPDDQADYDAAVAQSAITLEAFSHEFRIVTPSGKTKWLYASSRPEQRENGEIAWYGLVVDISEFKRVEEALRQSEERKQAILSAIPDLMTLVSAEGIYLGSIRSNALIDLVPADLNPVGKHLTEILPPEVAAIQKQLMQQALATGEVQVFEQRLWLEGRWQDEELRVAPCGTDAALLMIRNITDRKQAENALRHSEAALRRAQQVAHIGSWEIDVPTQKVTWSEESFHIFGWDVAQPEPNLSQFFELVHPDDRADLQHQISNTISTGNPYKTEFRIIHPEGSLRYVEARGEAVKNEQGQVVQLLGTNLDITDRQQAELALRQSEATKNQILKAIPDLIVWMTSDGTYIDLIDGGSVTHLYPSSEAVGRNLQDLMPPDLVQSRMNAIQQALQTGEVQIYEQQFLLQDEVHYEEVRVVAVGDDRILVIVRDITDRKRAEAALLDSETRFRSAFRNAPIGMALIGLDDRWIKVNPMLCDMLGCAESELMPLPASSLVHPEDKNKLQHCIQQVWSTENRNAQVELRYCCRQGETIWGALSLSLVRDAQIQPLYYVAQIQDITERQAIDRIKNEFISIVSHELRTPLTAIRGFLGLLDTGIYDNKPEKARRMINQALTNSDRLVRLVNDILDLERLSSGRAQFAMEVCDAETLMQQAVAGVQSIADQATVRLAIEQTTAQVWADPDSIIQTLTNLLSNAIKFSPSDSVITLSAQRQPDSVLFSVADQGRGIPADKLKTIFGRFQQVDVSDARQKGGTGLGLAICESIVQQHEGNIWVESTLGEGSTFYFTLPLPKGESHDQMYPGG